MQSRSGILQELLHDGRASATRARHQQISLLRSDVRALREGAVALADDVAAFILLGDLQHVDERAAHAAQLDARICECVRGLLASIELSGVLVGASISSWWLHGVQVVGSKPCD